MLILQWLFKNANEREFKTTSSSKEVFNDHDLKSQDIVLFRICQRKKRAEKNRSRICHVSNVLKYFHRKDIATSYFYSTIHLKRLTSYCKREHFSHCMMMKKQNLTRGLGFGRKADSAKGSPQKGVTRDPICCNAITTTTTTTTTTMTIANHIGQAKVLPINVEAIGTSSSSSLTNEKAKREKTKRLSKMKELIRWAAAAKTEKGGKYFGHKVLHLGNRSISKAVADDQLSNDSPKISFRWDLETSSNYSETSVTKHGHFINSPSLNSTPQHIAVARKGNWVTTDSEFVVLELEL